MNAELRGRKGLERSRDFHIWKVLGGGGALRGLKHLTYDSVVYFYFRYPLSMAIHCGGASWPFIDRGVVSSWLFINCGCGHQWPFVEVGDELLRLFMVLGTHGH